MNGEMLYREICRVSRKGRDINSTRRRWDVPGHVRGLRRHPDNQRQKSGQGRGDRQLGAHLHVIVSNWKLRNHMLPEPDPLRFKPTLRAASDQLYFSA
jgi:hypothetical protein